ncbi:hypothetical protein BC832DRAFT_529048 [Gaertneriomyces semiglobifer]|nr:hypothetical protein BC832DRAFT_529048 [Gaertneriomyces semiglobifer]
MGTATADSGFHQTPPKLSNPYTSDAHLHGILTHLIPPNVVTPIHSQLAKFGSTLPAIALHGDDAEAHPPTLTQYDHWSKRIDVIHTSAGWKKLKKISAREGLVAIAYEREFGEFSRIYQFAKQYMCVPDMAMFGCPLAMTDGAARLIELYGDERLKARAYVNLTTRDPKRFWTSGQWMTERPGGSDVGETETEAVYDPQAGRWNVSGFKWFSSATDAEMTFLLARTRNANGETLRGSKGLSLFYAELRDEHGKLNGIKVHRLKNKLGTKALPTAELELSNLPGQLVGDVNRGVPTIAVILNITRIYSALSTISALRRSYDIAKSYAEKRRAFGKVLTDLPLHVTTLSEVGVALRGCTHLLFFAVKLLGQSEAASDPQVRKDASQVLRLTTPLLKMFACKEGMEAIRECMEAVGGQGYMEETGIARQLRDANVNAIWEGTTNVQALDLLRIVHQLYSVAYVPTVQGLISDVPTGLESQRAVLVSALAGISAYVKRFFGLPRSTQEASARVLGFALARVLIGALMLDHAVFLERVGHEDAKASRIAVRKWCERIQSGANELKIIEDPEVAEARDLVFGPKL